MSFDSEVYDPDQTDEYVDELGLYSDKPVSSKPSRVFETEDPKGRILRVKRRGQSLHFKAVWEARNGRVQAMGVMVPMDRVRDLADALDEWIRWRESQ